MAIDGRQLSKSAHFVTSSHEGIDTGSLQRIADATEKMAASSEKMASNYTRLQSDKEMYERWYRQGADENKRLCHRIAALQGVITKMKKAAIKYPHVSDIHVGDMTQTI